MVFQKIARPDVFESLCDILPTTATVAWKRAGKSVDRTLAFLDGCLEIKAQTPVRDIYCTAAGAGSSLGDSACCVHQSPYFRGKHHFVIALLMNLYWAASVCDQLL